MVKFKRQNALDPNKFQYLHGCVRNEKEYSVPSFNKNNNGKLIYLSFGSLGSGDTDLLKRLINVLAKTDHRILVNVGDYKEEYTDDFSLITDKEISFKLISGDRVGLIGKNGAGKSTLLKLLSKEAEFDSGSIAYEKDLNIGFLKQDIDFEKGRTVLEEAYQAFSEIKILEKKQNQINSELSERTDYESNSYLSLIEELSEVNERYELIGGYNYQGQTEKILQGLGFERTDFLKNTDTFSGGWRMRIELAKLLLQNNDILLLDEPTNHLDIESIIWLETFLKSFSGAVVIVSHDKMFLNNITNRTIDISLGRIYDFNKPYSKYLVLREEIRLQQISAQKNQDKHIQHTEKLIEKFRAKASKASMAQSLIKKIQKIDRIEVDQDDNSIMTVSYTHSPSPRDS